MRPARPTHETRLAQERPFSGYGIEEHDLLRVRGHGSNIVAIQRPAGKPQSVGTGDRGNLVLAQVQKGYRRASWFPEWKTPKDQRIAVRRPVCLILSSLLRQHFLGSAPIGRD